MRPAISLIGSSKRQAAVHLDRFVGDARRARRDEGLRERLVRGQMQIGEKNLALRAADSHSEAAVP